MIWALYLLMALGAILFLAPAFLGSEGDDEETSDGSAAAPMLDPALTDIETRDYFAQIEAIAEDETLSEAQKEAATLGLQRQLLQRQTRTGSGASPTAMSPRLGLTALTLLVISGLGVYALVGRPDLTRPGALQSATLAADQALAQAEPPTHDRGMELATLVEQLETRLAADRAEDPQGWLIYARSLMNLGRFDEALSAYDRVVLLTNENPQAIEERDRAKDFVAQRSGRVPNPPPTLADLPDRLPGGDIGMSAPRGPTAEDVEAAQQMSEEDRAAMIEGMVDGLSARLEDNPRDAQGWARLLRARAVLGQTDKAAQDVERLRAAFADDPDTVRAILAGTEWE